MQRYLGFAPAGSKQLSLLCEPRKVDDQGIHFYVTNGAWHGIFKDGNLTVLGAPGGNETHPGIRLVFNDVVPDINDRRRLSTFDYVQEMAFGNPLHSWYKRTTYVWTYRSKQLVRRFTEALRGMKQGWALALPQQARYADDFDDDIPF